MTNQEIVKLLRAVAAAYILKRENRFKIMAYQRSADTIEHSVNEVEDLWKEGKLDEIPGIGPSLISHLTELFTTGKVRHFEETLKKFPTALFPLLSVPGLGPKKAFKLVKFLKLKNPQTVVDDLEKKALQGKIAGLEGFGEKSQGDIQSAIASFRKGQTREKRMALAYADAIAEQLIAYLKKNPHSQRVDLLGSLRRRVTTIGDLDIAVATEKPEQITEWFIKYPQAEKVIEQGPTGAALILTNGQQVDLRVQRTDSYGAMLQYFTGSKNHNIALRELALKKGLSLSEYGIKPLGEIKNEKLKMKNYNAKFKIYELASEKDFYETIGLTWISPELREDTGEIEAALHSAHGQANGLPKLVKLNDIKGDLHLHSDFPIETSHDLGVSSMREMIKKAESLAYKYLGFSEHSPNLSHHTPEQIFNLLKRRNEVIEKLKLDNKNVRIINLLEVDILVDGNLSINDKCLALLDGVIASVHSRFDQSKEAMTRRILKALANPKVIILGHPTGRLIGQREAYEFDCEKVFAFCKKQSKALEINANPDRLDLLDTLVRQAIELEVKLVITTDAHAVNQMDLLQYGVDVARRGWAEKDDILNTLGYNDFIKWIHRERR